MTIVVIDTETTGFGHMKGRDDAIIQVGIAWRGHSGNLYTWESLVNCGEEYIANADPKALEVNNVTPDMIRSAPHVDYVANELTRTLRDISCSELRAYNVAFDRPFLEKSPWNLKHYNWGNCIMLAATPPFSRWPKLKVACEQRGIDTSGPLHSAGHDAKLAYLLMEKLRDEVPEPEVQQRSITWS